MQSHAIRVTSERESWQHHNPPKSSIASCLTTHTYCALDQVTVAIYDPIFKLRLTCQFCDYLRLPAVAPSWIRTQPQATSGNLRQPQITSGNCRQPRATSDNLRQPQTIADNRRQSQTIATGGHQLAAASNISENSSFADAYRSHIQRKILCITSGSKL